MEINLAKNASILMLPSDYARHRLGLSLHPTQTKVLNALFRRQKSKVSFLAANECGKTAVVIMVAVLYGIEMLDCNVISTSGVYRQIISQLMPALRRYSYLFGSSWVFTENKITVNNSMRYMGFASQNEGAAQGAHSTPEHPLLFIVDEAEAVSDGMFNAVERCNPMFQLVTGSPLGIDSMFYQIENNPKIRPFYDHFKLTKLECLKKNGYWLDETDVLEFIERKGADSPLVQSSVYANFVSALDHGIITIADIENSFKNYVLPDQSAGKHVGIDFAAGGDENVIAFRDGNIIKLVRCWKERDTMKAAREIVNILEELKLSDGISASDVSGDADGLGLPIIQRIKELGWNINEFHGNTAVDDNKENYKNRITMCWLELCRRIKNGQISIPNDQELKLQLVNRKQILHSSGKLVLESKADMRERNVGSPDRADAVAMSCIDAVSGVLRFIRGASNNGNNNDNHPRIIKPYVRTYRGYF